MDKSAIFNEFKKKKQEESLEINNENAVKEVVSVPELPKIKNKNKRKNKKRNKIEIKKVIEENSTFDKWKTQFLSNELNQEFMKTFEFYRANNFSIFSDEEFLENKFKHPLAKTIILDPNFSELNAGKGGDAYLIKPMYTDEYNWFLKNVGTRNDKPEEFLDYCLDKCILFPRYKKEEFDKRGVGTILALYKYILETSDLTKTIRVLEV